MSPVNWIIHIIMIIQYCSFIGGGYTRVSPPSMNTLRPARMLQLAGILDTSHFLETLIYYTLLQLHCHDAALCPAHTILSIKCLF